MSEARGLRVGDWAMVRTADEILATLDEQGRLEGLAFMPEMLQYCGKTFRVFKSAHKTCDTIERYKGRRMSGTVHLEGLRCDGNAHGGCQAKCLLFWKEAWLLRVDNPDTRHERVAGFVPVKSRAPSDGHARCDIATLSKAACMPAPDGDRQKDRYACQATGLLNATVPLKWWEPGQYVKDLTSGNVRLPTFIRAVLIAAFNVVMRLHWRGRPSAYPYLRGLAGDKTPTEVLNLQPGELVQVRSKKEIMLTLNAGQRNRGMWFDVEMVPYCGKTARVLARVDRIINEKTGAMMQMSNPCIILEGVICSGCLSRDRLFCPRSIYSYWREVWLKRVE